MKNNSGIFPLRGLFVLMMPIAQATNPITGRNWQGIGVIPDIEVPAEYVLQVAHQKALNELLESVTDADEKAFLQAEKDALQTILNI